MAQDLFVNLLREVRCDCTGGLSGKERADLRSPVPLEQDKGLGLMFKRFLE